MKSDIPVTSLQRLPVYLNYLKSLPSEGYISSGAIAHALEMGEVLVRKDLAYTSAQGRTRVGYLRKELIAALEDYLGCNDKKRAVIFGAGELGQALLSYGGFSNYGIEVIAAFDTDTAKIGTYVGGKPVYGIENVEEELARLDAKLAVLCVPARVAQDVVNVTVKCGIKKILNFAPVLLRVPSDATVRNMDVAANLAILSSMT